jgi:hypothetical protein
MDSSDPEERVRSLMADMLETGRAFRAPVRPVDIRRRARWTSFPRIDTKAFVAAAAVIVLVAALVTVGRLHTRASTATKQGTAPVGWVAYSAYGLQVSVPRDWSVRYLRTCPATSKPGSLSVGEANVSSNQSCWYPYPAQLVFVRPSPAISVSGVHPRHIVVNGVHVEIVQKNDSATVWYVPSEKVMLRAGGTNSGTLLHTLTTATGGAAPLPGLVEGSAGTAGLATAQPSTGQTVRYSMVSNEHQAKSKTTLTNDGKYAVALSPGTYHFTASAGDAPCPKVTVKVVSGLTTTAPAIVCQGE